MPVACRNSGLKMAMQMMDMPMSMGMPMRCRVDFCVCFPRLPVSRVPFSELPR